MDNYKQPATIEKPAAVTTSANIDWKYFQCSFSSLLFDCSVCIRWSTEQTFVMRNILCNRALVLASCLTSTSTSYNNRHEFIPPEFVFSTPSIRLQIFANLYKYLTHFRTTKILIERWRWHIENVRHKSKLKSL